MFTTKSSRVRTKSSRYNAEVRRLPTLLSVPANLRLWLVYLGSTYLININV